MYLKINRVKDKKTGLVREYLRIVESYREEGKPKKRVIAHLGRLDLIGKQQLLRLSQRLAELSGIETYQKDEISAQGSLIFGPVIIIRKLWEELNLDKIIEDICNRQVSERAFVLTCCRLILPQSEHGLSYFLKEYYVCDNRGKRWEPEFLDDLAQRIIESNGKERVKVDWKKLQKWYRTLDKLIENKEEIELEIYQNIKNLFSLRVDLVFYDLTSIYFEGQGPKDLAKFGYSRDNKKDNKQILLGIVMANGLPVAHHIFCGNTQDKKTLKSVISDLEQRFQLKNIILVADKGINTKENGLILDELGYKYILGVSLRNSAFAQEILETESDLEWRRYNQDTRYSFIEIEGGDKKESWILVDSKGRKEYEEKMSKVWMEKGAEQLEELKQRVKTGRLKDEKKICYLLGGIAKRYHIKRYFSWEVKEAKFRYWLDSEKLEREKRYQGRYLVRTTDKELSAEEVIREYKRLWEIESCFRELKNIIKIRPIYHQTEKRTKAHIFIAVIAYLIEKILHTQIRQAGMRITAHEVLEFAKEVKVVEIDVRDKNIKLITQRMSKLSQKIFDLMKISLPRSFKELRTEEFISQKEYQRELFSKDMNVGTK